MKSPAIEPQKFVALWNQTGGSVTEVARILGRSDTSVGNTRKAIEKKLGITLHASSPHSSRTAQAISRVKNKSPRINLDIEDGIIVCFSDSHRWPGPLTTAQRAVIRFVKEYRSKLRAIANLGDLLDGAQISRHDRIGWDIRPNPKEELEACSDFLGPIEQAAPGTEKLWTLGNHDLRWATRLASRVSEYEGVSGFALEDHFPGWKTCMAIFVNDDCVLKHRLGGGIGAKRANTVKAGITTVTGHLHSLGVTEYSDYRGDRYGVDTGTTADINGPQFDYIEESPRDWRSGFAVLTWKKGKLLRPEIVQVWDQDTVQFRGELWTV